MSGKYKKNINTELPEGKYFLKPSNKKHKSKKEYTRKKKHRNETD